MDISEPAIKREDILILEDGHFKNNNVCIISGSGTGIGRATAIAAAANKLMTVGLDFNEEEGIKTQKMAREMGGQMIFVKTDLCRDQDIEHAVAEAAKLGTTTVRIVESTGDDLIAVLAVGLQANDDRFLPDVEVAEATDQTHAVELPRFLLETADHEHFAVETEQLLGCGGVLAASRL